jgi:hypothetical protein
LEKKKVSLFHCLILKKKCRFIDDGNGSDLKAHQILVWASGSLNGILKHRINKKEKKRKEIEAQTVRKDERISIILLIVYIIANLPCDTVVHFPISKK